MSSKLDVPSRHRATWRAIVLGSLLIVPNAYWIMQVEGVWNTGHSTCLSLMWHVVVNLLVLILLNTFVIKRFWPNAAFSQGELITIYTMLSLAGGVAGARPSTAELLQ